MRKAARSILHILILMSILPVRTHAQTCGTSEVYEKLLRQHPQYRNETNTIRAEIKTHIASRVGQRNGFAIYTIPVVVHVIHLGESIGSGSNITDAQITAAINGLNDRFSNAIGNSLDVGIEFCLAIQDPNGNPTTGINRVNGSAIANYASEGIEWNGSGGASESEVKMLSIWPRSEYYNIWVVHSIYGPVAGYAYYPTTYTLEGAVMEYAYMTYNSTVLTHEMGHAFDLAHTFEGDNDGASCPSNTDCSLEGDMICDTPPHKRGDCGSSNPCAGTGVFANSRYNYMSYCGSTDRFTADQQQRMDAAVNSSARTTLLNSLGCVASTCSTACADSNPCTIDLCLNGACSYQSLNCDDNNSCTEDICTGYECLYTQVECDDDDACTLDYCSGGCVNQLQDCADGDACTSDFCEGGQCYNEQILCDDSNPCTDEECITQHTSIRIDYDVSDENATILAGGAYQRDMWPLNAHFSESNQSNSGKLQWAATRFNWLEDVSTQQQYSYDDFNVRVDSIDVLVSHENISGTPDTIIIRVYEDESGVYVDSLGNIGNGALYADTIITTTSLSPDLNTPVHIRLHPGLSLAQGQKFMVGVHFYGSVSNTFHVIAGYGNRCSGGCAAYPSAFDGNSRWKLIFWFNGNNYSGINNLYYNCNGNAQLDPANCEYFYIQNYAISAYVTLFSKTNYECHYTTAQCSVTISGAIRTETNLPVSGVSVVLSGDASDTVMTGVDGLYSFMVPQGGSYTITPFKNNDTTTNIGVTTTDIALIRRHVLGSVLLDSPYKIIAADANNSGEVSTGDIPHVRIVVLNDEAQFPPAGSRLWEFVSGYNTQTNPFPFTKTKTFINITQSYSGQNFTAVKIGDVNPVAP